MTDPDLKSGASRGEVQVVFRIPPVSEVDGVIDGLAFVDDFEGAVVVPEAEHPLDARPPRRTESQVRKVRVSPANGNVELRTFEVRETAVRSLRFLVEPPRIRLREPAARVEKLRIRVAEEDFLRLEVGIVLQRNVRDRAQLRIFAGAENVLVGDTRAEMAVVPPEAIGKPRDEFHRDGV